MPNRSDVEQLLDWEVFEAAKLDQPVKVKQLINDGASPFYAIQGAALGNKIDIVGDLLEKSKLDKDTQENTSQEYQQQMINDAVIGAARGGHKDLVNQLLRDPWGANRVYAVRGAAQGGSIKLVNELVNEYRKMGLSKNAIKEAQKEAMREAIYGAALTGDTRNILDELIEQAKIEKLLDRKEGRKVAIKGAEDGRNNDSLKLAEKLKKEQKSARSKQRKKTAKIVGTVAVVVVASALIVGAVVVTGGIGGAVIGGGVAVGIGTLAATGTLGTVTAAVGGAIVGATGIALGAAEISTRQHKKKLENEVAKLKKKAGGHEPIKKYKSQEIKNITTSTPSIVRTLSQGDPSLLLKYEPHHQNQCEEDKVKGKITTPATKTKIAREDTDRSGEKSGPHHH